MADNEYGVVEWLRSHRVGLGPFYVATPTLAVGVALRFVPTFPAGLALLAIVLASGYWVFNARGWRRPYFAIVLAVAALWVVAANIVPWSWAAWAWVGATWLCATAGLAIPWWADSVRRTQVTMEATIRNWPIRASRVGLGDTWISGMRGTNTGWTAKLKWLPGAHTPDDVERRRVEIEGALGLQSGELRMPYDGRNTDSINLVAVTNDPHARPVLWDIPTDEVDGMHVLRRARVADGVCIGLREDSSQKMFHPFVPGWGVRRVLIGGASGSGKSGLLNLMWAFFARCEDAAQWGIDLKGGMELGPWRTAFDWVVKTRADAVRMLVAANAEMSRREEYCEQRGWKVWRVDKQHPILVISIDEVASLLGNARQSEEDLVAELARKGRALGIMLIMATQYPTLEALGSSQIREQIDQRFCFRMNSSDGEDYVIPDYVINAHKIPEDRPGTCYHQDGMTLDRMPLRVLYVEDDVIAQLVELVAGYTPGLGDETTDAVVAVVPEYADRDVFVPAQRDGTETNRDMSRSTGTGDRDGTETTGTPERDDRDTGNETTGTVDRDAETDLEWVDGSDVSLDALAALRNETLTEAERDAERAAREEVEPQRLDESAAYEALLASLRSVPDGVKVTDLMAASTRKSTWVYDKLGELEEQERVARTDKGLWRWSGSPIYAV